MQPRRLVIAPLIALAATGLVAAVIDTGQRTRAAASGAPVAAAAETRIDPEATRERARIDHVLRAELACVGERACAPGRRGANVRAAAETIASWPPDPRFRESRRSLHTMLLAQALVLDQIAMGAIDGRTSPAERDRFERLHDAWVETAVADADARFAAGLIDRAAHLRARMELRQAVPNSLSPASPRPGTM